MDQIWSWAKDQAPVIVVSLLVIYFQFKIILKLIDLNDQMGERLTINTALVQSMSDCLRGIQLWMNTDRKQTFPDTRP